MSVMTIVEIIHWIVVLAGRFYEKSPKEEPLEKDTVDVEVGARLEPTKALKSFNPK